MEGMEIECSEIILYNRMKVIRKKVRLKYKYNLHIEGL